MSFTAIDRIPGIVAGLRYTFDQGVTRPESWRCEQLTRLRDLLLERGADFERALFEDLGKAGTEAQLTEIGFLVAEIDHALSHLGRWIRPRRVGLPLALQPALGKVVPEPLGVVLVIAPWNYPLMLALSPVIGALAAGNSVVIKPSELAPATAELISRVIPDTLDKRAVAVVEGAVPETTALLAERFDHIFYTGNGKVGRIVARAAAENLTPVTLELGGKSPAYVDDSVPLDEAAKRLVWGKFMNVGQTCVAPDYVIGSREVLARLAPLLADAIHELYGSAAQQNPDYGRVVNRAQFDRLVGYLADGEAAVGGHYDAEALHIDPTVLTGVSREARVMQEEIFGPILPLVEVSDLDDALAFVTGRDKPLAAYVFSDDSDVRRRWERETSSGALAFGVPVMHLTAPELPFGGVGESGMGAYHGELSFRVFSHEKAVLAKPLRPDTLAATVMPPYTAAKDGVARKWLRKLL
ncbi:aldehyde dehydrogenase family protein [Leucobacter aridicollis]|uniref:aldehyde dehydrogenase family protein n=1 Tax=Leucobacter aridicollis TaxID=283878 RepID=UPI002103E0B2|nr:aldehyde dehydrogenase family protein [Leucobacter aridicollis]UTX53654.1 aldehyde dehydrogenase family protein [Leucobacter aridicollis]